MNPQDDPQTPQNPSPQPPVPSEPTPSPVQPPMSEPVAPQPGFTPPAADNPVPTDPFNQSAPAAPTQPMGGAGSVVEGKKPFPKKLVIILASVIGGLLILGLVAWLVILPMATGGKVGSATPLASLTQSMKTYEGDGFSILVPEAFIEKNVGTSGKTTTFTEDSDKEKKSSVLVSSESYTGMSRDEFMTQLKATFSEETFTRVADQNQSESEVQPRNFTSEDTTVNGMEAYKFGYDAYEGDEKQGSLLTVFVFGEDEYYSIVLTVVDSSAGFSGNVDRIINSFTVK